MEKGFEKYLLRNRGEFEKTSPSPKIWALLERDLIASHQAWQRKLIMKRRVTRAIAACLLTGFGVFFIFVKTNHDKYNEATVTGIAGKSSVTTNKKRGIEIEQDVLGRVAGVTDQNTRRSLYHYSQLIENRQKEIATLRQATPDLYVQSQQALTELNLLYAHLQRELQSSPDQKKILKSLIQNLQMQEQILNNQLQLLEKQQTTENSHDSKNI